MLKYLLWSLLVFVALMIILGILRSQEETHFGSASLIDYIKAGGWPGHLIILLSCIALAIGFVDVMDTRLSRIGNTDIIDTLWNQVTNKQYDEALKLCQENPSELANILGHALKSKGDKDEVIRTTETQTQIALMRINRRPVKFLFIGVISALIGLFGSLAGIYGAFFIISHFCFAAADMAKTIEESLVNPMEGIIVVIICVIFYFIIQDRVNRYALALDSLARWFISKIKQN